MANEAILKEAANIVRVEGALSEVAVTERQFERDGKKITSLSAVLKVKVNQEINNTPVSMEVPVHMFAAEVTQKGTQNPLYALIRNIQNEWVSIASANGGQHDYIRFTQAKLRMNEFIGDNGEVVSTPRVSVNSTYGIERINRSNCMEEASFIATMVVGGMKDEVDREGNPTGALIVTSIIPQFGNVVDVFPMKVMEPDHIAYLQSRWNTGDTVKVKGLLNFTSETFYEVEEMGFGDPIRTPRTRFLTDIVITGGSASAIDGDAAYEFKAIQDGLARRKAHLEEQKEKKRNQPKPASNSTGSSVGSGMAERFGF